MDTWLFCNDVVLLNDEHSRYLLSSVLVAGKEFDDEVNENFLTEFSVDISCWLATWCFSDEQFESGVALPVVALC